MLNVGESGLGTIYTAQAGAFCTRNNIQFRVPLLLFMNSSQALLLHASTDINRTVPLLDESLS